jgi:hypothetical protein
MKFRGEGFSTCTTGNFQSELTQFLCVQFSGTNQCGPRGGFRSSATGSKVVSESVAKSTENDVICLVDSYHEVGYSR